jgi:hypothetical protein
MVTQVQIDIGRLFDTIRDEITADKSDPKMQAVFKAGLMILERVVVDINRIADATERTASPPDA